MEIKYTLEFNLSNILKFWIIFCLLFAINDFAWKIYSENKIDIIYFFSSFIFNLINPLSILFRIKIGLIDKNALITFIIIFLVSFLVSFFKIKFKSFKRSKVAKR
ncbi:MAG: hypothetical protein QXQ14_03010 [Candidatus Aenigmatarchaeota archaeon]